MGYSSLGMINQAASIMGAVFIKNGGTLLSRHPNGEAPVFSIIQLFNRNHFSIHPAFGGTVEVSAAQILNPKSAIDSTVARFNDLTTTTDDR